jgi:hypothetical protein
MTDDTVRDVSCDFPFNSPPNLSLRTHSFLESFSGYTVSSEDKRDALKGLFLMECSPQRKIHARCGTGDRNTWVIDNEYYKTDLTSSCVKIIPNSDLFFHT